MPSVAIQWFPGHMAKTKRLIREALPLVDIVIELRDARIPHSSKNPEIEKIIGDKPRIILLNKSSMADDHKTKAWAEYISVNEATCIITDCITGKGMSELMPAVRKILADKLRKYEEKGMKKNVKAMIVGIPNVGKSSFINRLGGRKKAKVEDRPGVTRENQWIFTDQSLDLLDTPGVLWPKFEDERVGENLAFTGAIKDDILDIETLAVKLCGVLKKTYPEMLRNRYRLTEDDHIDTLEPWELFELIGRKRGLLIRGGEVDTERLAVMLLDEFRACKIGKITLDDPVR